MTEQPYPSNSQKTQGSSASVQAFAVETQLLQILGNQSGLLPGLFMEVHNGLAAIDKKAMPQIK